MKSSHWAQLGESTFVLGIWVLYGVHRLLGRGPFRLLLYPVVLVYWLTRGTARRASLQYLQRLQETHSVFARSPGWRESLRHFFLFGETLLDKMLAVGGRYEGARVQFQGQDDILAALRAGQGGVIVTAHMGCLELTQTVAARREGLRLTVLVHTAHAERFNRVLARIDPTANVRLLQVESFSPAMAMLLSDRVAAGEYIAIAGDRIPVRGDRLVKAEFLGRKAPFPAGPYLIASLLGCPVFALACLHHGEGYRVSIQRLSDRIVLPRATRAGALATEAARYAAWIEARLRESPYDWFNFFPFWDQTPHALPNE
jgi:predicted LPLAT superfamily acyltransferase